MSRGSGHPQEDEPPPVEVQYLDKLSKKRPSDAAAIEDAIEHLGEQPRPSGSTPLRGYQQIWRIRIGNHRLCYQVNDRQLLILDITISTRDNVYEILRRHLGQWPTPRDTTNALPILPQPLIDICYGPTSVGKTLIAESLADPAWRPAPTS